MSNEQTPQDIQEAEHLELYDRIRSLQTWRDNAYGRGFRALEEALAQYKAAVEAARKAKHLLGDANVDFTDPRDVAAEAYGLLDDALHVLDQQQPR